MNKFEKLMGFLEGLKMTIVGGIFLLISLILLITNTTLPIESCMGNYCNMWTSSSIPSFK